MQTVTKKDDFRLWVEKTNIISEEQGELDNLTTTAKSSVVDSLNEKWNIINNIKLSNIVDDLSPELGNNLDLNTHDIIGTGNISITGSYTGSLNGNVTTTTHTGLPEANSTSPATTAMTDIAITAAIALGIPWVGDVNGLMGGPILLNQNVVGMTEIDKTVSHESNVLQLFGTDGSGQLTFINTTELGAIGGEDLSGSISAIEILSNKITINELDLLDAYVGYLLHTNGAGTISFKKSIQESSITTTAGDQTFNINYIVGMIVVYLNGVKLINGEDFTANNGTSVVLTTAIALTGATIDFQIYGM
jgi:hypothetical protein